MGDFSEQLRIHAEQQRDLYDKLLNEKARIASKIIRAERYLDKLKPLLREVIAEVEKESREE